MINAIPFCGATGAKHPTSGVAGHSSGGGIGVLVEVGVTVGVIVGVFVDVAVGVTVGVFVTVGVCVEVGVIVGVLVTVAVGVTVGVSVGVAVGVAVGVTVGVSVTVAVGVTVGVSVGVAVGVSVGVTVGVWVGVDVGVTVGVSVGVDVGVFVAVCAWTIETVCVAASTDNAKPKPITTPRRFQTFISLMFLAVFSSAFTIGDFQVDCEAGNARDDSKSAFFVCLLRLTQTCSGLPFMTLYHGIGAGREIPKEMTLRRSIQACLLSATLLLYAPSAEADGVAAATEVIGSLQATFVEVLKKSDELGYQGRLARLTPAIEKAYDSRFMARAAIGRQWKKLDDADQDRWAEAFREFTIANYARRLDHYSGQTFETLGSEPGNSKTVTVRTRVIDPVGENVDLTYRLRETDGGWRIIDIFANGTISELALRRSEYTTVLKRDGVEKLIALVNGKTEDLAAGKQVN